MGVGGGRVAVCPLGTRGLEYTSLKNSVVVVIV